MKKLSAKTTSTPSPVPQNALSEPSISINDLATVRGVNTVLRDRFHALDFGKGNGLMSVVMSLLCNDGVIKGAYDTYREQEVKNLMVDSQKMTEKQ